jgi:hypothetical protein
MLDTQKVFLTADRKMGNLALGSDAVMIIQGHELLTFNVKTHSLPVMKNNEPVEYTTVHGVKTYNRGYLQTYNQLPVGFMERDSLIVKNMIEKIQLSGDDAQNLTMHFFIGKTVEKTRYWGSLESADLFLDDAPDADVESNTTGLTITANAVGHYTPSLVTEAMSAFDTLVNLAK